MTNQTPLRFSIETALGVMSALVLLTLTLPDWVERIFGLEPDGGGGQTEWGWAMSLVVAAFVLFAVAFLMRSRALRASASYKG